MKPQDEVGVVVGRALREANRRFDEKIKELNPELAAQIEIQSDPMYVWGQLNGELLNAFEELGRQFAAGVQSVRKP